MSSSSVTKRKILVVEDEPRIRQVCRRILTSQGYRVDFATNGAAAEDMLMEEDYDQEEEPRGASPVTGY